MAAAMREEPSPRLDRIASAVLGAAIEVHRHLGAGLLESVYVLVELGMRQIHVRSQVVVAATYKGITVGETKIDLLVEDELVVELKAVERLAEVHRAQVISYLRMGGFGLGLLINFNEAVLRTGIRRIVLSSP
jgi:GxxExxY protein